MINHPREVHLWQLSNGFATSAVCWLSHARFMMTSRPTSIWPPLPLEDWAVVYLTVLLVQSSPTHWVHKHCGIPTTKAILADGPKTEDVVTMSQSTTCSSEELGFHVPFNATLTSNWICHPSGGTESASLTTGLPVYYLSNVAHRTAECRNYLAWLLIFLLFLILERFSEKVMLK